MASDDLKQNARMNIIRALGGSPKGEREAGTKPPRPQVPPRPDPTPDEIARDKKLLVQNIVKTLQEPPTPPTPTQRTVSPSPPSPKPRRARSPRTSPSRQKTIADPTTHTSRANPPRPPPPRLKPPNLQVASATVTPPDSPMRRRSLDLENPNKPKPTVRRRKKFVTPNEEEDEEEYRQSEYLEITLQDKEVVVTPTTAGGILKDRELVENGEAEREVEHNVQQQEQGGQDKDIKQVVQRQGEDEQQVKKPHQQQQDEPEQQVEQAVQDESPSRKASNGEALESVKTVETDNKVNGESSEASSTEQLQQLEEEMADGWEVVESEDIPQNMKLSMLMKQASEDGTATTRILKVNESSPELSRSPSVGQRKKKPPPFRPPPYAAKTPPVPLKQRRKVSIKTPTSEKKLKTTNEWNQLVEEVNNRVVRGTVEGTDGDDATNEQGSPPKPNGEQIVTSDHVYEVVEPYQVPTPLLLSRPENLKTKHYSVSSLDSDPSPSSTMKRNESEDTVGALGRAGTMVANGASRIRGNVTGSRKERLRPMSLASISSRELEASFEVIPNTGSKFEEVIESLRRADDRYQDASIYELVQACSKAMPHITSTSDLPARIPDFPKDGRSFSIHELYTTEYTYVTGLEVLCEVFKTIMAPSLGNETSQIFANVDDILAFNKGFLALLHNRLKDWGPQACLGDIFVGMFTQSHKSMYAIYCSNYDSAEAKVLVRLKKKEFEPVLQQCLDTGRVQPGLTLPAYLITPVQRITRYILLLKDIIKKTDVSHPDYKNLTKANEIMGELADYINAQLCESQTRKTFESLKGKVHGLTDLETPERSLVKEGQVYLKNIKKLYQCILFNDLLVFAHGDSKQSKVELQLNLEAVWVEDLEDLDPQTGNEDAIEVYTPQRPYTIYTRKSSEKRLWLSKLRETIYYHLLDGDKCERSNDFNTESRHARFIYSDGRVYHGHYIDARRHGKGTMTWPNKSAYVGDWIDDERCGEGEFTYNTGDVYRGRWVEDRQTGMGELQFTSNDIYRGYWKDGTRHGSGKILYANGDSFEGHFINGQIEGEGKLKCNNGVEYEGEWKHSQRNGKGRLKTACGHRYYGEFHYNQIHGEGTMIYNNKDKYEGRWRNGMRNGFGTLKSRLRGTYSGWWENDLQNGKGAMTYPNGDVYDGNWEHNMRHGKGKMTFSTGMVYEGDFHHDLIHGEGEMKYSSECKYQGSWVNGLRHGCGAMVYEDKSSYNGDWGQGLRDGHGQFVTSSGSVYRGMWQNDKPHGKGTQSISETDYSFSGDWASGMKDGRGEEHSQYGVYKGQWKTDMKQGLGEERSLVGTIFEGTWDKSRKHGRGVRKMVFGTVEEQMWKSGQLTSDPLRMTAVELPFISRADL